MSDEPLTPKEFERLCDELADLDRKASLSDRRRKHIEEQLRDTISNERDERRADVKAHRAVLRLQRKAAREEGERTRKEQRAEVMNRRNPAARAKLQARIAELKECTKEELHREATEAQLKKKQDRALVRRWKNGNGVEENV